MIDIEEAREKIRQVVKILAPEKINILDSLGLVLAEDVVATDDIPPFDNSAMDGYAVIAEDTEAASENSPVTLKVIEDLPAGCVPQKRVAPGEATRIMTGAPLPAGADAVVIVERTRLCGNKVEVLTQVYPGANVRDRGEDVSRGETVLRKGAEIRPQEMGMLASLGRREAAVIRRAEVGILATGDELVEIDEEIKPGKIRNSNSYTLSGLAQQYGAVPVDLGRAKDTPEEIETKIRDGIDRTDVLLISGGVSVGKYDVVKMVLEKMGMRTVFWKVAMKPGKPLLFGMLSGKPIFGLPGNPVSSFICFEQFVRPALMRLMGKRDTGKPEMEAILEEEIRVKPGRTQFKRGRVEKRNSEYYVRTTGHQGSGILKSLTLANGLIIIPKEVTVMRAGERVRVQLLDPKYLLILE